MSDNMPTLFTRIINREIPADIVYEDDQCIVINDIAPQAPVHMLVIPRQPIPRLVDATLSDQAILGHLMWVAGEVARVAGVDEAFRLVVNNGANAGQTVFHLHLHVLASKDDRQQFTEAQL
ncbi:histidine triad nucleotide-binding protein [SAR92 clade bacterium H921]|jgi:histidine triad (HIT) family protein|nr:histidine triad nucleotide-binding protein [SAR92 clade bacterium H921]MDA9687280.1 histidine triad nucleotide-binding protein [bacterium]MDG0971196.1 histidine triad nucleotide-binding protein [Porticoccaceae bacterium]MDG1307337.1 histidine triad nucleotide-binding protein [Porticoccaceae bacterium]